MADIKQALKFVKDQIAKLEDEYDHYTNVERDSAIAFFAKEDLKEFNNVKECLEEKENSYVD